MHDLHKEHIKEQLERDVEGLSFTDEMQKAVLDRASRKVSFWDREITLYVPNSALAICLVVLIVASTLMFDTKSLTTDEGQHVQDRFIDLGTGLFSERELRQFLK